jgi:AraC-like DNA-binding protein
MTGRSHHSAVGAAHLRFWRPFPRESADVICGEATASAVPIHAHDALQLLLPASRFAVVDGRDHAVIVRPGQVHVTAPLELHGAQSVDGVPCAMRLLLIAPATLPNGAAAVGALWRGVAPGLQQCVVDDTALHAELWTLAGEMRGPLVSLSCVPRLVACLSRLGATSAPAVTRAETHVAGIARVRDHLRAHVSEPVSLDELAHVAGLSKFYLLRAFRRAFGVTPHAYQMQLRLAHAWRCIVEGRPLSRTTYDVGFADQSHLTRRFAAAFGTTPGRYLRQLAIPPGAAANGASATELTAAPPFAA